MCHKSCYGQSNGRMATKHINVSQLGTGRGSIHVREEQRNPSSIRQESEVNLQVSTCTCRKDHGISFPTYTAKFLIKK